MHMSFLKKNLLKFENFVEYLMAQNIYCSFCGSFLDGMQSEYGLCDKCMGKMDWIFGETCEKCGKPLRFNHRYPLCPDCMNERRFFHRGYVTTGYGLLERTLISDFKIRGNTYLSKGIARMMADKLRKEKISFDIITSVPVHKKRMNIRGFNQSDLLAKEISKITEMPYCEYLLRKCDTIHMKELDRWQRRVNIENAFEINVKSKRMYPLESKNVLLIDDILTTGATINQCSKVLTRNGANRVNTLVFAG